MKTCRSEVAHDNLRTFAVLITYVPNAVERRAPHREAHLAYVRALHEAGRLALGGAFADPVDGALLSIAPSRARKSRRGSPTIPTCAPAYGRR